jgi:hypothetical protein
VDALASEYGWQLSYIFDELPLCQALALWRAAMKRNNPNDKTPGFDDDDMLETQGKALRAEIAAIKRQTRKLKKKEKSSWLAK